MVTTKSGLEKLLANIKKVDLPRKSPFEKIYTNDEMEKLLELIDYDDQAELSPSEVETLKRLMEQNYPVKFDQAFKAMGKVYIAFSFFDPNGGGRAAIVVCYLDKSNIKPVYAAFEAGD